MNKYFVFILLTAVALSSLYGCGMPMLPSASATFLSPDVTKGSERIVAVGKVVAESDCFYMFMVFGATGNPQPSHERLIDKILTRTKTNVLLDADLSTTMLGLPPFFMSMCAEVSGQPARLTAASEVTK